MTTTTLTNGNGHHADLSSTIDVTNVRARFCAIVTEVSDLFIGKDTFVHLLALAVLTRHHVAALGLGGTAKSAVTDCFLARLGGERFSTLLHLNAKEEDVFGPVSLSALKDDRYERATDRSLVTADFAFLDEGFTMPPSLAPALNGVLNERTYKNGQHQVQCPLNTAVVAANQLPQGHASPVIGAFWDRFLFRLIVEDIADGDFIRYLNLLDALEMGHRALTETHITLEALTVAQAEVAQVSIPEAVKLALLDMRKMLRDSKIRVSDRRVGHLRAALRANAWLEGRTQVSKRDFEVLRHILWEKPEQQAEIATILEQFNVGELKQALSVNAKIRQVIQQKSSSYSAASGHVSDPTQPSPRDKIRDALLQELNDAIQQLRSLGEQAKLTASEADVNAIRDLYSALVNERKQVRRWQ